MKVLRILLSLTLLFSIFFPSLKIEAAQKVRVAVTKDVKGNVHIKKGGGKKEFKAKNGFSLREGDSVRTETKSSVNLVYDDGTKSTVGPKSKVVISKLKNKNGAKQSKVKMISGKVWNSVESLTNANDEFEIETPTAVMGVRGTLFLVSTSPDANMTKVIVLDGEVGVSNNNEQTVYDNSNPDRVVAINETLETKSADQPLAEVQTMSPQEFVQEMEVEILVEVVQDVIKAAEDAQKQANELKNEQDLEALKNSVKQAKQAVALTQISENLFSSIKSSGKDKEIDSLLKERNSEPLSKLENQTKQLKEEVKKVEQEVVKQAKDAGVSDTELNSLSVKSEPSAEITYTKPNTNNGNDEGSGDSDDNLDNNSNENPTTPPPTEGNGNLIGKVYLSNGQVAPEGGIRVRIRAVPQIERNWCTPSDSTAQVKNVTIPKGDNLAFYTFSNLPVGQYKIEYEFNVRPSDGISGGYSINDLYYSSAGPVSRDDGEQVDVIDLTTTTINLYAPAFNFKKIKGTISLPNENKATGDMYIHVHAYATANNQIDTYADSSLVIPKGESSVQYELNVPTNFAEQFNIEYNISNYNNDEYIGIYNNSVNIQTDEVEGINIELQKGQKISGTILLEDIEDLASVEGGYVHISAYDGANINEFRDGRIAEVGVEIEEGQNSVPFTLIVPQNKEYILSYFYSEDSEKYAEEGYYSESGTVYDRNQAQKIVVTNSDIQLNEPFIIGKAYSLEVNISLPDGKVAPSGGIPVDIGIVFEERENGYSSNQYKNVITTNQSKIIFNGLANRNYKVYYYIYDINECNEQYGEYEEYFTQGHYWYNTDGIKRNIMDAGFVNPADVGTINLTIAERPTLKITPSNGATVTSADTITLEFSKPVGREFPIGEVFNLISKDDVYNTIKLIDGSSNQYIQYSGTVDPTGTIITLDPLIPLEKGREYSIMLYDDFVDSEGFKVVGPNVSIFKIASENSLTVNFSPKNEGMFTSGDSITLTFSEPISLKYESEVKDINDSDIGYLLLVSKDNNVAYEPISYTASINDDKTVIEVYPNTSEMVNGNKYKVDIDNPSSIVNQIGTPLSGETSSTFTFFLID